MAGNYNWVGPVAPPKSAPSKPTQQEIGKRVFETRADEAKKINAQSQRNADNYINSPLGQQRIAEQEEIIKKRRAAQGQQTGINSLASNAASKNDRKVAEQQVRSSYQEADKKRLTNQSSILNPSGSGSKATGRSTGSSGTGVASSSNNEIDWSKAPKPSNQEQEKLNLNVNQSSRTTTIGSDSKQTFDIASFQSEILNNDVLPTHTYLVSFAPFRAGFNENKPLTNFVVNKRNTLIMRCENVVLPTPSLLEEENIRRFGYGPVEKVPYGVQFSDVTMTWLVDSNSEIVDFMHQWMNTIVMHDSPNIGGSTTSINSATTRDNLTGYNPYEVGYKDAYTNPIVRIYVYNRQQQTVTEYEMYDVFPMSIQSMNLSWADENQVQKLTVTFAYTNMRMHAPIKSGDQFNYVEYEGSRSPLEERIQPDDKGGRAAADRADSPLAESITTQANASRPNATEAKQTSPTGVIVNPNSTVTRVLGP